MREFNFATVITTVAGQAHVSHLPLLLHQEKLKLGVLEGHMALANPHHSVMEGAETLCIFHGPHAYISPSWYADPSDVPTWNYAVVHVTGRARLVKEASELDALLSRLVVHQESSRTPAWNYDQVNPNSKRELLKYIVGFEIEISRINAKFKLGQNRAASDRLGAAAGLLREGNETAQQLATLMKNIK